jgi:4-hydroxybenzoyl-CoA thioesterase
MVSPFPAVCICCRGAARTIPGTLAIWYKTAMKSNVYRVTVEWGDTDPAGIVFYPNYFRWFDAATRHLLESVGLRKQTLLDEYQVIGLPIVEANARFLAPSSYGDALAIHSEVREWAERSLVVGHRVLNGETLRAEGFERRVFAARHPSEPGRLQTKPIPEELRRRFEA